jgi:hypothetical protein
MAVSAEIARSWRAPRAALRRQLDSGVGEDRALIYLVVACLLIFVAQWPRLAREAHLDPSVPLDARVGAALLGWMFMAPLMFYALAALSHLLARLLGGKGSWFSARLALFWTMLVVSPLWLFYGLVAGFMGPGGAQMLTGIVLLAGFLGHWGLCLVEAEGMGAAKTRKRRDG